MRRTIFAGVLAMTACTILEPPTTDAVAEIVAASHTFDENGAAVVSVGGDEDVAAIYVTVGNGTDPADPTVGTNDGSVVGRGGVIETSVKITTGRDAHIKAVAADSGGNLGPVRTFRQARRLGPFHKDTTSRGSSGTTLTTVETITVPAGVLGADGALRLTLIFQSIGSSGQKEFYVLWDGVAAVSQIRPSSFNGSSWITVVIAGDGATDDQEIWGHYSDEEPVINITRAADAADTTGDVDIEVKVRAAGTDAIALQASFAELIGTN
jgi:hypothetical protein